MGQSKMNEPLSTAPLRVRITSCSRATWWYGRHIGKEFDVNDPGPRMDFVLWEDYCGDKDGVWRHIAQVDCIIIKT